MMVRSALDCLTFYWQIKIIIIITFICNQNMKIFSYLFLFDDWLADDKGSCKRYAILYQIEVKDVTDSELFTYLTKEKMFDSILLLSILWRPSYSIFTRCQRLCCVVATFSLNMIISAMWFNSTSTNEAKYQVNIGPVSVSYLQLYVGTIALVI